jgi:aminopeptidase N
VLNNLVYQKGGWVLHMLRQKSAPRISGPRFASTTAAIATTMHRPRICARCSSRCRASQLDWFFTQWLNRPGVPKIEGSWHYDAAIKELVLLLSQTQSSEPYRVNIDVGVVLKAGELPVIKTLAISRPISGRARSRFRSKLHRSRWCSIPTRRC